MIENSGSRISLSQASWDKVAPLGDGQRVSGADILKAADDDHDGQVSDAESKSFIAQFAGDQVATQAVMAVLDGSVNDFSFELGSQAGPAGLPRLQVADQAGLSTLKSSDTYKGAQAVATQDMATQGAFDFEPPLMQGPNDEVMPARLVATANGREFEVTMSGSGSMQVAATDGQPVSADDLAALTARMEAQAIRHLDIALPGKPVSRQDETFRQMHAQLLAQAKG